MWTCSGFAVRHCFLFILIVGCLLSCWQHGMGVRSTSTSLGPGTLPCRLLCSTLPRCDMHTSVPHYNNLHLYQWTRWKSSITMRNLKFSMCYLHCDACVSMFAVGAGSGECRAMQRFLLSPLQAAPQTEATTGQTHWTMGPSQVSTLVGHYMSKCRFAFRSKGCCGTGASQPIQSEHHYCLFLDLCIISI